MCDPIGFLKYTREERTQRPVTERLDDHKEIFLPYTQKQAFEQSSRCMSCGTPFCQNSCPAGSNIADWIDYLSEGRLKDAFEVLQSEINFPEFTSRLCKAPCEASCVLGINQPPVSIKDLEHYLIETAFANGWVQPFKNKVLSSKKVAIIGSGPSGLAAADDLSNKGYSVTVFERKDRPGGMLRYGIPDCRLEKWVLERRLKLLQDAGIIFKINANVGVTISINDLLREYDALILCCGSTIPRDLKIPGRELKGVHLVMDFLEFSNRCVAGDAISDENKIVIEGKDVFIPSGNIDGWIGAVNRFRPRSITVFELLPKPPEERTILSPWPTYPIVFRTSPFHEVGMNRRWAYSLKEFIGDKEGNLVGIRTVEVEWRLSRDGFPAQFIEIAGSESIMNAQVAILAFGYLHPQHSGLLTQLGIELDERGNVKASDLHYQTNVQKIFAAGDVRRGQSEIIWAIKEGKSVANSVDKFFCS